MSSFGVKAILRQTIIGTDSWFKDSEEILAEQKELAKTDPVFKKYLSKYM